MTFIADPSTVSVAVFFEIVTDLLFLYPLEDDGVMLNII